MTQGYLMLGYVRVTTLTNENERIKNNAKINE